MTKVGTNLCNNDMIFIATAPIDSGSPEVIPSRIKRRSPVSSERKSARLTNQEKGTPAMALVGLNSKQDSNNSDDNVLNQHEE